MINHPKPFVDPVDSEAITAVLDSEVLAQGAVTADFEEQFSGRVGGAGGVATACGTNALALGLAALEDDGRKEIILPTYVCRSVLDAVIASGQIVRIRVRTNSARVDSELARCEHATLQAAISIFVA